MVVGFNRDRSKKSSKRIFLLLGFILIGAVVLFLLFWSHSASNGTIDNGTSNQPTSPEKYLSFNSKYIAFKYKSMYSVLKQPASGQDLENYMFTADTTYSKQIAVSVEQLPGGNLNNNTAYAYRKVSTDLYTNKIVNVGGITANEWLKDDGSEVTAFIVKGDTVAVLAFTSQNPTDQLAAEANNLLASFQWQ